MAAGDLNSPFQCGGTVKHLPDKRIPDRVVIRIDDADPTAKVLFTVDNSDPAADNADGYLLGTESYEIRGGTLDSAARIRLLNVVGNPLIYFAIH